MLPNKSVALIILDGWGLAEPGPGNAVKLAATPVFDRLMENCPHTSLQAGGEAVGLPAGQMGNSEVGHMNIGAGRVVYQELSRIDRAIADGSLNENPALREALQVAGAPGRALHFMGLLSDGGVHSQQTHLEALLRLAAGAGLENVFVHAFLDGRDTAPDSGLAYVRRLESFLDELGCGRIASVGGRFYGMDRDQRWERVEKHWRTMVLGEGESFPTAGAAVEAAYAQGVYDEFIDPVVIEPVDASRSPLIAEGDAVVFFNFRGDRAREITLALTRDDFTGFSRPRFPHLGCYVCMTEYDADFGLPTAFPPQKLPDGLGQVVSDLGLRQLRIAETEKYAHVTFFFNGGREAPFAGEERCLVPSPRDVKTYDLRPEMSAVMVADELLKRLAKNSYSLIILNFANCDMVGHTGNVAAAVRACETVDSCLARILAKFRELGITALITADHGNAEALLDEQGRTLTAHSLNPVPLVLVSPENNSLKLRDGGILADVAPTLLDLLGISPPSAMTGQSLLLTAAHR